MPLFEEDIDPHLMHGSLCPPILLPKRHLDRFSRFCRAHERDQQTDMKIDYATPCVAKGRYH